MEYSSNPKSILGGIKSLKARGVGNLLLPAQNMRGHGVDIEVEITEDTQADKYAWSCATQEVGGTAGIAGQAQATFFENLCLFEDFDHILFRMTSFAKGTGADSTFAVVQVTHKFSVIDVSTNSRIFSFNDCAYTEGRFKVLSR